MLYLVVLKIRESGTVCSRRFLRTRQIQFRVLKHRIGIHAAVLFNTGFAGWPDSTLFRSALLRSIHFIAA
jgi:hypothetical protein